MKIKFLLIAILTTGYLFAAETYLTIYSQGFSVISEIRKIKLDKGKQVFIIDDLPEKIEYNSLQIDFPGKQSPVLAEMRIKLENYETDSLFSAAIGKEVTVRLKDGTLVSGQLKRKDPTSLILEKGKAGLSLIPLSSVLEYTLPESEVIPMQKEVLECVVNSPRKGEYEYRLHYICPGITWRTEYNFYKDSGGNEKGKLEAGIWLINNTSGSFADASISIIAGEVSRVAQPSVPVRVQKETLSSARTAYTVESRPPEIKSTSPYYSYLFPGKYTLLAYEEKRLPLIKSSPVKYSEIFRLRFPGTGTMRSGMIKETNLRDYIKIVNDKKSGLGNPLPQGVFKAYEISENNFVNFLGESSIPGISIEDTLEIFIGQSFDVKAKKLLRKFSSNYSKKWEEGEIAIILHNRGRTSANVEIIEPTGRNVSIGKASHPYREIGVDVIKFVLKISPESEETISYSYRKTW